MNARKRVFARIAILVAALAVVCGAAIASVDLVADETAQARALVANGQRDLAKGDRAGADLSFERARLVAPRAAFVRSSIAAANIQDAEPPLIHALRIVTAREWFAMAIAAGWACGLGIAFAILERPRRRARIVAAAAGALLASSVGAITQSNASAPAIVTAPDARLLVAPYSAAAVVSPLSAGTMVVVGPPYDGYVRVEDADGNGGWVPQKSIEPIRGKG